MSDYLTELEQLVLLALVRLGTHAYGVTIRRELVERGDRDVSLGALYRALDRLEDRGYAKSRLGEPTAERGGRAKRYFEITAPGKSALNQSLARVQRMSAGLAVEGA